MTNSIYLDWNASSPVHPEVEEAISRALREHSANPSSIHAAGRRARRAVEEARASVAALIGAGPADIVFTGGGSESNNLAIVGTLRRRPGHVVTTAVEHPSVLGCLEGILGKGAFTELPVTAEGVVEAEELAKHLRPETALLTVMRANNETGTLQPVAELARRARGRGIRVHTDAAQAVGKIPVSVEELEVDLLSLSSHKMRGPKGVGALFVREGVEIAPLVWGGGHERGLRAGTENVPGIVGLGRAAEIARRERAGIEGRARELRDTLEGRITSALPETVVLGGEAARLPNTSCLSFPGVEGLSLVQLLDLKGVAVSTGAACHAGSDAYSHVLRAMGVPPEVARGTVRISLGPATSAEEIDRAAGLMVEAVREMGEGSS